MKYEFSYESDPSKKGENTLKYKMYKANPCAKNLYLYTKEEESSQLHYTIHVQQRLQQRGIPQQTIHVIHRYGKRSFSRGAETYCINKAARRSVDLYLKANLPPKEYRKISKHLDCYIIIKNNIVITIGNRNRRRRN